MLGMESKQMTGTAMTDEQIIHKHDTAARGRAYIELQIVNAFIAAAAEAGYELKIGEMDEVDMAEYANDFRTALFDLDDAHVNVFDGEKRAGWVYFVFGNDGYDCISDYSTKLEEFLKPVMAVADRWGA